MGFGYSKRSRYVPSNLVPYSFRRTFRVRVNRVFVSVKIAGELIWKTCHEFLADSLDLFSLYIPQIAVNSSKEDSITRI